MEYLSEIKPFDEFWLNCSINNIISILFSYEPSYKYFMYSNDYCYNSSYIGTHNGEIYNANFVRLDFFKNKPITNSESEFINSLGFIKLEKCNYKDTFYFLEEINELLKKRKIIAPLVDLYYWNKNGYSWNNNHKWHYTLLTGYSSERKEYFAIEDDAYQNYGIITESESTLISSIQSNWHKPKDSTDYLKYTLPKSIPKYVLPLYEVKNNIQKIITSINQIDYDNLFIFENSEDGIKNYFWLQPYFMIQIINRQNANIALLKRLYQKKCLDNNSLNNSLCEITNIINIWKEIRSIVIKVGYLNMNSFGNKYYSKLRLLIQQALEKELYMWKSIEDAIVSFDLCNLEIDLASP